MGESDTGLLDQLIRNLVAWRDCDLYRLRDAINAEFSRRIFGEGLEAKAKAAEKLHDD